MYGDLIETIALGTFLSKKYDKNETYVKAFRNLNSLLTEGGLDHLSDLYTDSEKNMINEVKPDLEYEVLYNLAKDMELLFFVVLLLIYPYHLRYNYFHGSRVHPLVLAHNDIEFKDFIICNYYFERYLDENIL